MRLLAVLGCATAIYAAAISSVDERKRDSKYPEPKYFSKAVPLLQPVYSDILINTISEEAESESVFGVSRPIPKPIR